MKTCYFDRPTRSICDLTDYYGRGLIITRINVPMRSRGQGVAHRMLTEILKDADEAGITLYLEICSSDGLSKEELQSWYERHGFVEFITGFWRRKPLKNRQERA